jgi:hypothetical protein
VAGHLLHLLHLLRLPHHLGFLVVKEREVSQNYSRVILSMFPSPPLSTRRYSRG